MYECECGRQKTDRLLRRMSNMQMTTNYTLLVSALTLSATILVVSGEVWLAGGVAVVAIVLVIALLRLMARINRADRF